MKSYKFKLKPNKKFIYECERTLDICREIYNAGLQERRDAWKTCRKSVSYFDQTKELTQVRKVREDVESIYSMVGDYALRQLDKAFQAFFRRVKTGEKPGYPRFKGKDRFNSFTYRRDGFKLEGDKLILSKIGSCRLRLSRPVEGKIKTCTIKRQIDGWFVTFAIEEGYLPFIPKTGDSVGIDVGLENFATLSTGEIVESPRYLNKAERELRIQHRRVSKKKLRGSNRKKSARLLVRKYQKVSNQRRDFFHKLSNRIVREFDEVTVENLNIKGMVKNHHLAKSISDAAWNTFILILTAKAENTGRRVWKVPAAFTSQDCSQCGNRVKKSLSVREHRCIACGFVAHRDHNAAINIKARSVPFARAKVTSPDDQRISN